MTTLSDNGLAHVLKHDRFGNIVDPTVSYARGTILRSNADEILRQRKTYRIARERRARLGPDSIYNLTGLIRGFRFEEGDHAKLYSYIHFGAIDEGLILQKALARMGGNEAEHDGFLCNRVSAAALATMMGLLKPGDLVYSIVPADRCHPSVKNSVLAVGGRFEEVIGADAFIKAMDDGGQVPKMVVITTISPSKHHMPEADTLRALSRARELGACIVLDDAHMSARLAVYGETPSLAMGADIAFWSLDKHCTGPRSGFLAGRTDLVREIRAKAFMFGLEAQLGSIVAGENAIDAFDPEPIRSAAGFTDGVMSELQDLVQGKAYRAGPGIAFTGEDLLSLALQEAGLSQPRIVPIEATAVAGMALLKEVGAVTISVSGMPGSACVYRLMSYPDGERLGKQAILDGTRYAISTVARVLNDPDAAAQWILG
ncbi:hypothetical protein H0A73_00875 [Alcaligenaceae bacterium]|nr:hypothetical protein [Alcaligenaceae bacterium]